MKKAQKIKWYKEQELGIRDKHLVMQQLKSKVDIINDNDLLRRFENYLSHSEHSSSYNLMKEEKKSAESRSDNNHNKQDIPDFLLCRITDELMEEPVILESGFTYEKKAIE